MQTKMKWNQHKNKASPTMSSQPQLSIYIPRIHTVFTEDVIRCVMEYSCTFLSIVRVGQVARIDFTPINSNGFHQEENTSNFRSAYVYFINKDPIRPYNPHPVWDCIEKGNSYQLSLPNDCPNISQSTDKLKSLISRCRKEDWTYWTCLKNKKPVPFTYMNIHQVVDNCIYLENQLIAQKSDLENQLISQKVNLENYMLDQVAYMERLKSDIGHLEDEIHHLKKTNEEFLKDINTLHALIWLLVIWISIWTFTSN